MEKGDIQPGCDERWLAVDARRHALDDLRSLQILPHRLTQQRLGVLQRLTNSNPFTAGIVDHECRNQASLIVSQWIPGLSVSEWLQRQAQSHRRISLPESLRLYGGLVRSICGFHRTTGLVHGDIHPDNMVIASHSRWLILIDYGSAWRSLDAVRERQTQGFRAMWAAPEIHAGGYVDHRSDQFSATLLLFVMLTGELPFDRLGGRIGCMMSQHSEPFWQSPVDVIAAQHQLPRPRYRNVDKFLGQSLSLDPDGRFATDAAWIAGTNQLVGGLRTSGSQESLLDRLIAGLRAIATHRRKKSPG